MIVTCEKVRAVRDSNDKQIAEAVYFRSYPVPDRHITIQVNVNFEDEKLFGTYKQGFTYNLDLKPTLEE
jgi:hypothetical protein